MSGTRWTLAEFRQTVRVTVIAVALAFAGAGAASAALTAQVAKLTGIAQFRTSERAPWQPLAEKAVLNEAAVIRTHEGASVTLIIGGKGFVVIHELSTVILKVLKEETPLKQDIQLALEAGKLWNKLSKKEPNDTTTMSVHTPAAVASVRGTSFFVESHPETFNARVGVWEGVVQVDGVEAGAANHKVTAGFRVQVVPSAATRMVAQAGRELRSGEGAVATKGLESRPSDALTLARADKDKVAKEKDDHARAARKLEEAKRSRPAEAAEIAAAATGAGPGARQEVAADEKKLPPASAAPAVAPPAIVAGAVGSVAAGEAATDAVAPGLEKMQKPELGLQAAFEASLKAAGI